jgi:hypothetical protein
MIVFGFQKQEIFWKPWKFLIFFENIWGKWSKPGAEIFDKLEPEPEPKFLTSWSRSRSRTKMDRLRNTGYRYPFISHINWSPGILCNCLQHLVADLDEHSTTANKTKTSGTQVISQDVPFWLPMPRGCCSFVEEKKIPSEHIPAQYRYSPQSMLIWW